MVTISVVTSQIEEYLHLSKIESALSNRTGTKKVINLITLTLEEGRGQGQ